MLQKNSPIECAFLPDVATHMGELRSYCTVALETLKCSYLRFGSTDLDNFFLKYSLASTLLTVKISSLLATVAMTFSSKKDQKSPFLALSTYKNHCFPHNFGRMTISF